MAAAATLALVGLAVVPAVAMADPGDDMMTTRIGNWGTRDGINRVHINAVSSLNNIRYFTLPRPGNVGPISYTETDGTTMCLSYDGWQANPFTELVWWDETMLPCQQVRTILDPDTGVVAIQAVDGEFEGRYLGDQNQGGIVDWDSLTFFGNEMPDLMEEITVTPTAPTLEPAPTCEDEPTVVTPSMAGVEYTDDREGYLVTVTAVAVDGYYLPKDVASEWQFDVTPEECGTTESGEEGSGEEPGEEKPGEEEPGEQPGEEKPGEEEPGEQPGEEKPGEEPAPEVTPLPETEGTDDGMLAATGMDENTFPLALVALSLTAAGGVLLLMRRELRSQP